MSLPEKAPTLRATALTKAFGRGETRTPVLRGVDFAARGGEITFIVGPSGCGKTTLITALAGLLRPDAGRVEAFGLDLGTARASALARFRAYEVGFVFQQFNLLPALDAAENAALPLIAQGWSMGRARCKAATVLERLGLGAQLARRPAQLSGGQQQRIAIARALVHEPRLVVCDEPTASLDGESGRSAMELLRSMSAERADRVTLVVTHDDRIYGFADRIVEMSDGRMVRARVPAMELSV